MSETPTAAPTPEPAAPVHDEYLTSGARFMRWNLVSFVLALVALGVGALILRSAA